MTRSASPFVYDALPPGHIRLLYHRSDASDEDTWSLKTVSLGDIDNSHPVAAYDALSYTWGDQNRTFPLIVNGRELRVHHNLNEALPFLARRRSALPIWIDALCINQADEAEKATQVRRMHAIYRRADRVWVWLGSGVADSTVVHDAVALLPRLVDVTRGLEMPSFWGVEKPVPESLGLPASSSPLWDVIHDLIGSKWYGRLWIVQEAALASRITVLYGNQEVEWDILQQAVENCGDLFHRLQGFQDPPRFFGLSRNHVVFLVRTLVQHAPNWSGQRWIAQFRRIVVLTTSTQQCFAPQDRVLGLLGLLTPDRIAQIGCEDEALPAEQLYVRLTHFLLTNGDPTAGKPWWRLLHFCGTPNRNVLLPSWCPDYPQVNARIASSPLELHEVGDFRADYPYRAGRSIGFPSQPTGSYESLVLRGKAFDIIGQVYPKFTPIRTWTAEHSFGMAMDDLAAVYEWENALALGIFGTNSIFAEHPPEQQKGEKKSLTFRQQALAQRCLLEPYWQMLVAGVVEKHRPITLEDYISFHTTFKSIVALRDRIKSMTGADYYDPQKDPKDLLSEEDHQTMRMNRGEGIGARAFLVTMSSAQSYRRPCRTIANRLALCPETAQAGDILCVLHRSVTPHALRPSLGPDRPTYRFVGQAYVHGMMNGEVEELGVDDEDMVLV